MAGVRRWLLAALAAEVLVLFGTGIALYFQYAPRASGAGPLQLAHRSASWLAVTTALAAAVVVVADARRVGVRLAGVGLLVAAVAASVTGFLLPWDQLALWAVTVGSEFRGFDEIVAGNEVRFVLLGGAEIEPSTLLRWLVVHTMVFGPMLAALVTALIARGLRGGVEEVAAASDGADRLAG